VSIFTGSYVLAATGALAAAPIIALVQGALLRRTETLAPRSRARWITGMLAFPWVVGAGLVLVTLGHCVVPTLFGAVDDCVPGVGVCVREGAPVGRATLVLALAATTVITVATAASILFAHRVHTVAESMLSALARA